MGLVIAAANDSSSVAELVQFLAGMEQLTPSPGLPCPPLPVGRNLNEAAVGSLLAPFSELLGHSSMQTTLSIYQHVETDDFRAPMDEMTTESLLDVTKLKLLAA